MTAATLVFVSHAGRDRAWAEWVSWELTQAGYRVELALWDWEAGENFVEKMRDALDRCDVMVALFSLAYFEPQRYTSDELTAVFAGDRARVVPVKIEQVTPPALYRQMISVSIYSLPPAEARSRLINAVAGPARPSQAPPYPDAQPETPTGPRLPGSLPAIWNVTPRNTVFTGRDRMLVTLREDLLKGGRVLVQALHGVGGVGKPSSPWSTPTVSPTSTTWSGGSTANSLS